MINLALRGVVVKQVEIVQVITLKHLILAIIQASQEWW